MNEFNSSLSSWNDGNAEPSSWFEVTCDSTNTSVTELDLYNSNIVGPFPASILCNLTTLILYNSSINDALPQEISLSQPSSY
ncbi:hypothetical protein K1719_037777 [Acacia pycnantha]|nr:hypothetical protein K1719_037777 [Acacia pycnantha]